LLSSELSDSLSEAKNYRNFGTGLMLCIAYSASIGGMATIIGTPPNVVMVGIFRETYQSDITFVEWIKVGLPISGSKLHYLAPVDARNTGFMKNYFDFASSTSTLEHIPKEDLVKILEESYRILKKGGILSVRIDYKDHWSYFDKKITIYNYLKYSEKKWRKYNPPLHFQNRLRHSDYLQIISDIGFKVVKEETILPTKEEKEILRKLDLATMYRRYDPDDLGIKESVITLLK
jgi:SAM-dependent methyltransferase